jgi:hypothetical protein
MAKLTLKPEQDGTGYFYGHYVADDGTHVRVDVLPPKTYPRPYFVMDNSAMHDTEWLIYANGDEIARVSRREDIDALDITALLPAE